MYVKQYWLDPVNHIQQHVKKQNEPHTLECQTNGLKQRLDSKCQMQFKNKNKSATVTNDCKHRKYKGVICFAQCGSGTWWWRSVFHGEEIPCHHHRVEHSHFYVLYFCHCQCHCCTASEPLPLCFHTMYIESHIILSLIVRADINVSSLILEF